MPTYDIEIYTAVDSVTDWYLASSHTQSSDRDLQMQRFLASGILPVNIRNKQ